MKILNQPVEMIAHFGPDEYPVPLKFKTSQTTVRISSVLSAQKTKNAGIDAFLFDCIGFINEKECRFSLKYVISRCKWYIFKK
ncbi:MAG: hypothetical protein GX061_05995 [Eubacteriaceae bacterium]|nr:hypothetical protein [Eubacteriaceae bacterium]